MTMAARFPDQICGQLRSHWYWRFAATACLGLPCAVATAECCSNPGEYADWCRSQGGTPFFNPPRCIPRADPPRDPVPETVRRENQRQVQLTKLISDASEFLRVKDYRSAIRVLTAAAELAPSAANIAEMLTTARRLLQEQEERDRHDSDVKRAINESL